LSESAERRNQTLALLGIQPRADAVVLFEAPPTDTGLIGETYQKVNDHLAPLVRENPALSIRHLTGESRVLKDPAHRRILRESTNAKLGCFVKDEDASAWSFLIHATEYWSEFDWFDLVDTLDLAARGHVEINILAQPEDVHFSTFGDRYLLLQDKHEHPQPKKWVWYIESRETVARLEPHVAKAFADANALKPVSSLAILEWLYDYDTTTVVNALAHDEQIRDELVNERKPEILRRLEQIRFLQEDGSLAPRAVAWLEDVRGQPLSIAG
jgi:hypothetical protein